MSTFNSLADKADLLNTFFNLSGSLSTPSKRLALFRHNIFIQIIARINSPKRSPTMMTRRRLRLRARPSQRHRLPFRHLHSKHERFHEESHHHIQRERHSHSPEGHEERPRPGGATDHGVRVHDHVPVVHNAEVEGGDHGGGVVVVVEGVQAGRGVVRVVQEAVAEGELAPEEVDSQEREERADGELQGQDRGGRGDQVDERLRHEVPARDDGDGGADSQGSQEEHD